MKVITVHTYVSCDGEVFEDKEECIEHESMMFQQWLESELLDVEDFVEFLRPDNTCRGLVGECSSREVAVDMLREYWQHINNRALDAEDDYTYHGDSERE